LISITCDGCGVEITDVPPQINPGLKYFCMACKTVNEKEFENKYKNLITDVEITEKQIENITNSLEDLKEKYKSISKRMKEFEKKKTN